MDDLEQVREYDLRLVLIHVLSRLAQRMPVIVNTVNPIPDSLMPDHTLIELFNTDNDSVVPIVEELPPGVLQDRNTARSTDSVSVNPSPDTQDNINNNETARFDAVAAGSDEETL